MELDGLIARRDDYAALRPGPTPPRPGRLPRAPRVWDGIQGSQLPFPGNRCDLSALGPAENGDAVRMLWVSVAKSCRDLASPRGLNEGRDLRRDRDGGQSGPGRRVEEVNALVIGTASRGDKPGAPWTECDGLDCSPVSPKLRLRPWFQCSDAAGCRPVRSNRDPGPPRSRLVRGRSLLGERRRSLVVLEALCRQGTSLARSSTAASWVRTLPRAKNPADFQEVAGIVVPPRCEKLPIRRPCQAANLLPVE